MDPSNFKPTLSQEIIKVLKDNFGLARFEDYFDDDPLDIPQTLMPCIIVEKEETQFRHGPTGMDDNKHFILIKLVYNKKDDFGKPTAEMTNRRRLELLVQGVDNTTDETSQATIVGILRKNFTLGNLIENQDINVQYNIVPRPQDVITSEAHVRIVIDKLTAVSGRA